jgi:hypothetical protein
VYSHVVFRERESSAGQFAVFDVSIYDEQGRCLVELEEFTMVRIKDRALLGGEGAPPVATLGATASPRRPSVDLANGIGTSEGVSVLWRIMASGLSGQVVVSPQDLNAVIAQSNESAAVVGARRTEGVPLVPDGPDLGPLVDALLAHPAVHDAAATAAQDATGETRIVAYIVYDAQHQATVSELRKHLRTSVSEDMVPHTFVDMNALPRGADGRIDYAALDNPFGVTDHVALPESPTEMLIAGLWKELLGISTVSVHDNFFDVGGHSLLSMRLIARLDKKTGVRLQHEHVVVNTLRQLAAKCDHMLAALPPPGKEGKASDTRDGLFSSVRQTMFGGGR